MFLLLVCLIILQSNTLGQHWTYEEQNNWDQLFRSCGGRRQSPINIDTNLVEINPSLYLYLINYDIIQKNTIVNNNGHTVRISLNPSSIRPQISGSAVNGNYIFEELHFHWGDNAFDGTEHMINNIKGSAELHLVHYNENYGNLVNARDRSDGIVVLTAFLELANNDNEALQPIINALPKVMNYNRSSIIRERINLGKLLPPQRDLFYRYKGSLTTPPCSESVTFVLFKNPIRISAFQLAQFRRLSEEPINGRKARIISNTRDQQQRNGRIVEASVPRSSYPYYSNQDNYNYINEWK